MKLKLFLFIISFSSIILYSQTNDSTIIYIDRPIKTLFNYKIKYFYRNDTIFAFKVFPLCIEEKIDSVYLIGFYIKHTFGRWKCMDDNLNNYSLARFRRIRQSNWYIVNNEKYFNSKFECIKVGNCIKWHRKIKD